MVCGRFAFTSEVGVAFVNRLDGVRSRVRQPRGASTRLSETESRGGPIRRARSPG